MKSFFCFSFYTILFLFFLNDTVLSQFKLTMQFSGMNPHIGQMFELRVTDKADGNEVGRKKIKSIAAADFNLELYILLENHSYNIDFFADLNGNGFYNSPPTDHVWREELNNVQTDQTIAFSHHTNFTDTGWAPLIDFEEYAAIWSGRRTNFTFGSGGSFEMQVNLSISDMKLSGSVTAVDAFGIGGSTTMDFEGLFFQDADSAIINPTNGSGWTGTLFWVNGDISGTVNNTSINANISLDGTLGRTQAIVEYAIDIFAANGIIVAQEDSILTTIKQDSLALVALYDSTGGVSWSNQANWKTGPVNTWFGITLTNNRVSALDLSSNNLSGAIPAEIGDLTELTVLKLNDNNLTGDIPSEIGNLKNLEALQLQQNNLSGAIPEELGGMENLIILWLFDNELSQEIPAVLGNLSSVTQFNLSSNELTGEIPASIWDLVNLLELRLNNNELSGSLPAEIGNLTQLKRLHLEANQFSGVLPAEIGQTDLFDLTINNNNFEGDLPGTLTNFTDMLFLNISANNFSGAIPGDVANFSNMQFFWADNNRFSELPDLSGIGALGDLRVSNNKLTFEDIEPNVGISNFRYSPQDSVGASLDTTIIAGGSLTLNVSVGGSANLYQWLKNGMEIPGATNEVYTITDAVSDDGGNYVCRISNTIAIALTLSSKTLHVEIQNTTSVPATLTPGDFALYPNYPNPFNPETTIQYDLPKQTLVRVIIFDALGRTIRTLVDQEQAAGTHSIIWDGRAYNGLTVASGLYFYKIEAGEFKQISKMVMIK